MHRADRLHVLNRVDRLVVDIYRLSAGFPDAERYGLSSQVRRAAVSIGSNIVEGAGYGTNAGFIRQLRIARGSLAEVAYQVRIAHLVGYISAEEQEGIDTATQHIRRMLTGLISSLKA